MAGYSHRTLAQKLGIKPGHRVAFLHAPRGYHRAMGTLPPGVRVVSQGRELDLLQYFSAHRQALASVLPGLQSRLKPSGALWISWPKETSGVATDLSEMVIRHLALQHGLVDVKVIAVDATWSGLKLVIPKVLRALPGR